MRKALIVGIDHYESLARLVGCARDAMAVRAALERHADGSANFVSPRVLIGDSTRSPVSRRELWEATRELFTGDAEIALLYFAGHGHIEETGGYLCCSDTELGGLGVPIADIMTMANRSSSASRVIILDSCHSGAAGNRPDGPAFAEVRVGTTILTASEPNQYALEGHDGGGVFTTLLVDALNGAAASLVGDVTPASIYAHIDRSLGPWEQRPLFKTHVKSSVSLRKAARPIPLADLQALPRYFPASGHELALDPAFEPKRSAEEAADPLIPPPDPAKTLIFAALQRLTREGLVRPVGTEHMYYAAMESRACRLTVLGEHWRDLASRGLI